jgi:hypothetical protein
MLTRAPDNRAVALKLAASGYYVFPCEEAGEKLKRPKYAVYWRSASTTDAAKINRWWDEHPDALVGLDCGKSGLFIADADRHGGPDGVAAWDGLIARHGDPHAPSVSTPSNGVHYYFRQPDGEPFKNARGALPKGIDVRGSGGYVIAPGSTLPDGRVYELRGDLGHAPPIPPWMIEILTAEKVDEIAPAKAVVVQPTNEKRITAYAQSAVDGELDALRSAPKGTRNETLNKAAFALGTMAGAGWITRSEAAGWLADSAAAVGLPKSEAAATIRSGLTAGMKEPRGTPEDSGEDDAGVGAESARNLVRSARGDLIDNDTGEVVYEKPEPVDENPDWLYPVGLLGAMTDWIVDTTPRRPNRPMALAAAISIVGTVLGRHLSGPTESGTHLYIACIGETAAGKDRPMRAIGEILDAAGLGFLAISGKFKSDVALENAIADNPCSVAIIDEIGQQLFASIMGRKAGTHQANIGAILREAWPRSFSEIVTSCSAARKGHRIKSPAFSIFGASTVDEFYASLSGAAVDNGFINRFLIIKAGKRSNGAAKRVEKKDVPGSVVAAMHRLMREAEGNLDGGKLAYISQIAPAYDVMPWADDEVHAAYEKFDEDVLDNEDSEIVALMSRTAEMAVRLATIHAASRGGRGASLTMVDWEWGKAIAMHSAEIMTLDVRERMADNDVQARYKLIERLVREAGEISRRNLCRKLNGKIHPQEIDKIIGLLADGGVISKVLAVLAEKGGRPSVRLVYNKKAKTAKTPP